MAAAVDLRSLHRGSLLAEGGEGRVYLLPDRPSAVFKAYRAPVERGPLERLVDWPGLLEASRPDLAARVRDATAWPTNVVVDPGDPEQAVGLLLPRAPRRFSVRHRDGSSHLATISYLAADPAQRSAAYGLSLPGPVGPQRFALVLALARLLEAFEVANPPLSHGDLSAKNVLWSLQRGAEVWVLDCDSSEVGGDPVRHGRRRAMTPNWEDPAVPSGSNPTRWSDRYSLALIFLRVCGAAHFPIQARQKQGSDVAITVEVPARYRRVTGLEEAAPIWDLCARGLSRAYPDGRPSPAAWSEALSAIVADMGAAGVRAETNGALKAALASGGAGDVAVRPVLAESRSATWTVPRIPAQPAVPADPVRAGGLRPATRVIPAGAPPFSPVGTGLRSPNSPPPLGSPIPGQPPRTPLRVHVRRFGRWWSDLHRQMSAALRTRGTRGRGIRRLIFCVAVDLALAVVSFFVAAMLVSPFLGI